MSRNRNDNERLNRLASEVKGGGGLELPSFFGALLNELLDNDTADTARMVEITTDLGANKTKKLAEIWSGSWELLTSDLMEQLGACRYVSEEGGIWSLGEAFEAGVRLEVIPARRGLNGASGVTVWPKDERDARSQARELEVGVAAVIRQPRDRPQSPEVLSELRTSYERHGPLTPVLLDQDGRHIIDGRTRTEIDPDWPVHRVPGITTDEQIVAAIIELDYWHKKGTESLSKKATEKIKGLFGKTLTQNEVKRISIEAELRSDANRSNHVIADTVGTGHPFVAVVREKLESDSSIHQLEFPGGRGGGTTEHSAECWCGEGDYVGPQPKAKKGRPNKKEDPELQQLVVSLYENLSREPTGREIVDAGMALPLWDRLDGYNANTARTVLDLVRPQFEDATTPEPDELSSTYSDEHTCICSICGREMS